VRVACNEVPMIGKVRASDKFKGTKDMKIKVKLAEP